MNKIFCLFLGLFCVLNNSTTQVLSPSVFSGSGGSIVLEGITLQWTMGESLVSTVRAPGNIYTEGFHQPELIVVPWGNNDQQGFQVNLFPNPVHSILTVNVRSDSDNEVNVEVLDLMGRKLYDRGYLKPNFQHDINLKELPSSVYLIRFIEDETGITKVFKVHKTR